MTHSLHRQGTVEDLSGDFVVLAMAAKGINEEGAADKLREFLHVASQLSPVSPVAPVRVSTRCNR